MFKIVSRIKTNGNYTLCAKMDYHFSSYGNKIEENEFISLEIAFKWIIEKGRIYYITSLFERSSDLNSIDNEFLDAGNNYFIRRKYCWDGNEWIRQQLTTKNTYKSKYDNRKKYGICGY